MCRRMPHLDQEREGASVRGFTLVELLIVLFIILLVSILALPTVIPAFSHRQVSEAARILQGELVGARDRAIHTNQPAGIRLLPDPTYPITYNANGQINPFPILAYNRIIPLQAAPDYSEGKVAIYADGQGGSSNYPLSIRPVPCLVVEQSVISSTGLPNAPTSWYWNLRVGDKIQLNNVGNWYTIIGPMVIGPPSGSNSEMFVNIGPPGTALPTLMGGVPAEYLLLVNGVDDNKNGWIDEGFDGVDNNGNGLIDEAAEWETEAWRGAIGH